jgi:hypothetical protein
MVVKNHLHSSSGVQQSRVGHMDHRGNPRIPTSAQRDAGPQTVQKITRPPTVEGWCI